MKKATTLFVILLVLLIMVNPLAASSAPETTTTDAPTAIDWAPYDQLIADIKAENDPVVREQLMHEAEDMLMDTGAIAPICYYSDLYMMKEDVEGVYTTLTGEKYFMFASKGDDDTLRINISSEPVTLDPALGSSIDDTILALNSFAGLYAYDENSEPVPDLAEGVEISEDGLTYTFTMKPDLKWSDGSQLTAADFEWSWKRAAATGKASSLNIIDGYPDNLNVTASEDGRTLTVVLQAPAVHFLNIVSHSKCLPVHQATVEGAEGYKDDAGNILDAGAWAREAGFVSNGAFTLAEWKHDESMKYVKNPNYHRADEVTFESLEFMLSTDGTINLTAYEAGDLDFICTLPYDVSDLFDRPDFHIVDWLATHYMLFNVKSDLLPARRNSRRRTCDMHSLLIDRSAFLVAQTG